MTASCTPRCTYIRICTLPLACYVKVILCVQHRPSFLPCFLPSFLPSRAVPSFLPSRTVLLFEHDTLPCLNMPLQQRAALKKREDQKLRKRKSRQKKQRASLELLTLPHTQRMVNIATWKSVIGSHFAMSLWPVPIRMQVAQAALISALSVSRYSLPLLPTSPCRAGRNQGRELKTLPRRGNCKLTCTKPGCDNYFYASTKVRLLASELVWLFVYCVYIYRWLVPRMAIWWFEIAHDASVPCCYPMKRERGLSRDP